MKMTAIGERGTMITFEDLVDTEFACTSNVYLIQDEKENVMVDTFLGSEAMAEILEAKGLRKEQFGKIINTHSDWDHIWGNAYFDQADIICHCAYSKILKERGNADYEELKKYARGSVSLEEPTLSFEQRIILNRLDLEVFSSPGHSLDSITVFDRKDKVLVVGDNCELPIPSYVNPFLLQEHLQTLKDYLNYDFEQIIPGHGPAMNRGDLAGNITYLEDLIQGDEDVLKKYNEGDYKLNHLTNLMYMESQREQHEEGLL
ncbi:hypothetical protein ABB02_00879 [Clostridiaceae bacterium JG1575]|nr:hypothetical protein ABB02_00879 [Clostridiaceae bacterium JG1575]